MWTKTVRAVLLGGIASLLLVSQLAAAVTPEEAAKLKTTLTPLGAEKAGNADGTIPAWTGGYTTPLQGFTGGRRPNPFANDKPVFSITAKNMDKYADKLSDGTKAMLKKYPESYRLDVYKTMRSALSPQWYYDNTFKNATRAKLIEGAAGPQPSNMIGGLPFPIPKEGAEVMWNHLMRYTGHYYRSQGIGVLTSGNGQAVLVQNSIVDTEKPWATKDAKQEGSDGDYQRVLVHNIGPPIRAGESIIGRFNVDDTKAETWVYLVGQRRVRKLPNSCCDTPNPISGGMMSMDEYYVWSNRLNRFTWKLLGKKELYIPYNTNATMVPTKYQDIIGKNFMKPELVR